MKTLVVVLALSAILFLGHSSLLEHLLNNTHLRGNMHFNTTDGVKLGYNGKLVYDNGYLGVEIANLGASFKAVPKKGESLGNSTNGTVDYNGDIEIAHHHHKASTSVDGTAGLYVEYEKEYTDNGGHFAHNSTLTNHAFWTVNTSKHEIVGTTVALLNISTEAYKEGHKIHFKKHYYGALATDGSFNDTNDTNHQGNFTITDFGKGHLEQFAFVLHHPDDKKDLGGLQHLIPSIAYGGIGGYQKARYAKWNNDSIQNLAEGKSLFSGLAWIEHNEDNSSVSSTIHSAKAVGFGHVGKDIVNHKLVDLHGGIGTVGTVGVAGFNYSKDGNFSYKFLKAGDLHHIGIIKPHPKDHEEIRIEDVFGNNSKKFVEESLDDSFLSNKSIDHHHDKIKTFVHARWGYASGIKGHVNDDNSTDIATHGGEIYDAIGFDSRHKKPWHHHGGKAYNTSFVVRPHECEIKDIKIQIGRDDNMLEKIRSKSKILMKDMQKLKRS